MKFPGATIQPDAGNVVLTARVRAARDLDPHASVVGEVTELTLDHLAELEREPARRGDTELAGVGAGARRDVDQPFGPGLGEILAHEDRVDFGQRPEWHPSQNQVLLVCRPHGALADVSGDPRDSPELPSRDITTNQPHVD